MVIKCDTCQKSVRETPEDPTILQPYLGRARRPGGAPAGKMLQITCSGTPYEVSLVTASDVGLVLMLLVDRIEAWARGESPDLTKHDILRWDVPGDSEAELGQSTTTRDDIRAGHEEEMACLLGRD